MGILKHTAVIVFVSVILFSGNGILLNECLCSIHTILSSTDRPAENLSDDNDCNDCTCCKSDESNCCSSKTKDYHKHSCKHTVHFIKIPHFYALGVKIQMDPVAIAFQRVPFNLFKTMFSLNIFLPGDHGPPGKTAKSILPILSSFLL